MMITAQQGEAGGAECACSRAHMAHCQAADKLLWAKTHTRTHSLLSLTRNQHVLIQAAPVNSVDVPAAMRLFNGRGGAAARACVPQQHLRRSGGGKRSGWAGMRGHAQQCVMCPPTCICKEPGKHQLSLHIPCVPRCCQPVL